MSNQTDDKLFIIELGFDLRDGHGGAFIRFKDQFGYLLNFGLVQKNEDDSCQPQWVTRFIGNSPIKFHVFNLNTRKHVGDDLNFLANFVKPEDTADQKNPFTDTSIPLTTFKDHRYTAEPNCTAIKNGLKRSHVFSDPSDEDDTFECWTIAKVNGGGEFLLSEKQQKEGYVMSIAVEAKDPKEDTWKLYYYDPEMVVDPHG